MALKKSLKRWEGESHEDFLARRDKHKGKKKSKKKTG